MTGQLEQILLALNSPPVINPGVNNDDDDDDDDNNPNVDSNNGNDDANKYDRYYMDDYETVTSVHPNTPRSYKNLVIVLGQGDTYLWKSRSDFHFHVTVITTTFHQALSNLHYKVMLASEGTYVENV